MTITVRGSNIAFVNSVNPGSISLPAGSAIGDFAIVLGENGFTVNLPNGSNWHTIDFEQGSNVNGAAYGKLLDGSDVSSGSISVPFGSSFAGILALIVFVGGAVSLRTYIGSRNATAAASRSLTTDSSPQTNDYAIYFGSTRDNFAVTSSSGTSLQTSSNVNASGVLAGNLLGSSGAVSSTFTYSAGTSSGDYQIIVIVQPVAPPLTTLAASPITNETLSGYDLIASSTGAGGARSSRFVQGKTYFEATPTTLTGTPSVGVCQSNWNTSTALQSAVNTLAYLATGAVQVNGTTLATIATWAAGNRIDCAIDPLNLLIWFRVAGGNWNNNALNDPATGVGGIDYSAAFTQLGTLAAAVYASLTGNVWKVAFNNFAGTPPSGFSSLDTVQYTLARNVDVAYEVNPLSAQYFGPAARNVDVAYQAALLVVTPSGGKSISGIVEDNGTPVSGKTVRAYDEATGVLVGSAVSGGSGLYTIVGLAPSTVYAIAIDPPYNALVFDDVTPA